MAFRLPRDARLVRFPSTAGLSLEGRLTAGASDRGVVLCHPHPFYGGSMLTPVILTVEAASRPEQRRGPPGAVLDTAVPAAQHRRQEGQG